MSPCVELVFRKLYILVPYSPVLNTWGCQALCLFSYEPVVQRAWFSCRQAAIRHASAALRNKLSTMTEPKSPTTVKENRALPLTTEFTLRWTEPSPCQSRV